MIDFNAEKELHEQWEWFHQNGASFFPDCILQLGVQTGLTSIMAISVYPGQDSADKAMTKRDEGF